jgi:hypothetical protein
MISIADHERYLLRMRRALRASMRVVRQSSEALLESRELIRRASEEEAKVWRLSPDRAPR